MKKIIIIILAGAMLVASSGTCMAKEVIFKKSFVDSNKWTNICSGKKETKTSTADLKITNIYKADGSNSLYSKVKAAVNGGTSATAVKGQYVTLKIPSNLQAAGKSVPLIAMGNNPALDCKISGYWVIY